MNKKILFGVILSGSILFSGGIVFNNHIAADSNNSIQQPEPVKYFADPQAAIEMDIGQIVKTAVSNTEKYKNQNKNKQLNIFLENGSVNSLDLNDPELHKWIVRRNITYLMEGKNIPHEQIINESAKNLNKRKQMLRFANQEYNIKINQNEVNEYINEQMKFFTNDEDMIPFVDELAKSLGIDKKTLFTDWEYDNFLNNYIWLQLKPKLEEKYPMQENELHIDYDNRIVELSHEELNNWINKKKVNVKKISIQ